MNFYGPFTFYFAFPHKNVEVTCPVFSKLGFLGFKT